MSDKPRPYRGPSYRYKIKRIVSNNISGDSFAINIPKVIANMFKEVEFNMFVAGNNIILASGCKIEKEKKEILMV